MIATVGPNLIKKTIKKKGFKKMKKSIKRIISFALMLSLLVGMMAGFTAFAAETETVEIVSKNVYYGDTLNLMYAVNSTSDNVVVNIYKADGTLVETIDEYKTETVNGAEAKVFISENGVPAQNIDTEFYAVAEANGIKSATVKYSVLEYLYERLTVSEGVTAEQATMYKSLLAFADAADVVVNNDTTTNISKYAYVRVTNGTVDGTNTAAMVMAGTALDKVTSDLALDKNEALVWNVKVDNLVDLPSIDNVDGDSVAEIVVESGKAYILTPTAVEVGSSYYEKTVALNIGDYAKANNWANSVKYTVANIDLNVTATASGGDNTGKYYTNGNNWRFYQNENATLTISAGDKNIVSVKVTYTLANTGVLTLGGSNVSSGAVVDVNASSVTFGVGNTGTATNGNVQISAIEVVYEMIVHDCVYSDATCTAPKTCTICGATDGDALGHSYDEGKETTPATCTTTGVKTYTCHCGNIKTETTDALGHTTEQGTCDRCGKEVGGTALTEKTYSYTFVSKAANSNGDKTLGGVVWNVSSDSTYFGNVDSTKGQQYGSGNAPAKNLKFTSESFSNVSKIVVNTSGASGINCTFIVKVNGQQVGSAVKLTTTATGYTFELETPVTGEIEIIFTNTAKAIYVKSITVNYAE